MSIRNVAAFLFSFSLLLYSLIWQNEYISTIWKNTEVLMCLICWCLSCPQRASIFHASLQMHIELLFSLSGAHTAPRHLTGVRSDLNLAEIIWHSVNFQVNTLVFINEFFFRIQCCCMTTYFTGAESQYINYWEKKARNLFYQDLIQTNAKNCNLYLILIHYLLYN